MNYCTNCGTKLKSDTNYCTKCGVKVGKGAKPVKKGTDNTKLILILGIFLVLFSTFVLGIITWKNLNEILRICFFGFETVLFFVLSFILKKIDSKIDRVFFIIGLIFIPYTLTLLPYYGLLPSYFNVGAGLYIYLALLYLVITVLYFTINIKFKSKFVNVLLLISLLVSFINIGLFIDKGHTIIALLILLYLIVIYFLSYINIFGDTFKKIVKVFTTIMLLVIVPYLMWVFILYNESNFDKILNIITTVLYLIFGYFKLYKENSKLLEVVLPISYVLLTHTLILCLLNNYSDIDAYVLSSVSILLSVISILFNKKLFSLMTTIFSYISLGLIITIYMIDSGGISLIILSLYLLMYNIFNIISKNASVGHYFIPITIFSIVLGILNEFFNIQFIYVLLISNVVFILIYITLKLFNNKYDLTYYITAFTLSILSIFDINTTKLFALNADLLINICIFIELYVVFILSKIFKEQIPFSVISFVFLIIASLVMFEEPYYGLLTISGLTLVLSLIINKINKINFKPFIIYSQITLFVITLINSFDYSIVALIINVLLYVLAYISIIKYNNNKVWRIFYIIIGFISIYKIFGVIFGVPTIAALISIIVIIIAIVIMYLLDIENKLTLTFISFAVLIPYYNLVSLEFSNFDELYVLPFVIYTFAFTEVVSFKDETNKKLTTIIPISVLSIFIISFSNNVPSIIFDVIYSLLLIMLGLYRKYSYFIYFGVILIVLTVLIQLFTILDSIAVVIALIILGFILIGIGVYLEIKKNNKQ